MKYSIIIPVYNRPDEVAELLESLCRQSVTNFEVIIVEDGSAVPCEAVAQRYTDRLDIHYFFKENGGPGPARNYGVERATGDYVIILDSDVILPPTYLTAVNKKLIASPLQGEVGGGFSPLQGEVGGGLDSFGGPDAAHPDFTPTQKAINYAMTSFFTTGGIRGGKHQLDKKFFPRSFNMGVRREVYNALGGFSKMRFGEDVDFSYRLVEAGYTSALIPEAWVWHKRRANFRQFFKQVHNSGIARINLSKRHPGTLKLVHLLPAIFSLGVLACLLLFVCGHAMWYITDNMVPAEVYERLGMFGFELQAIGLGPLVLYALLIFADSSTVNHSCKVGLLSVPAAFIQLIGYGTGFLRSWWQRCVLGRDEFEAFKTNFYK